MFAPNITLHCNSFVIHPFLHPLIPGSPNSSPTCYALQPYFPNGVPWKARLHKLKQSFRYKITLQYETTTITNEGLGLRSRYSDSLRAGRSGDRIPVGDEIFRTRPDRPWGPTQPPIQWYRVSFSRVKRPRRGVDHPPHLASRLKNE